MGTETSIPLLAEDRFIVIALRDAKSLCPRSWALETFANTFEASNSHLGQLVPIFDLRGLEAYYSDVADFVDLLAGKRAHILVSKRDLETVERWCLPEDRFTVLTARGSSDRPDSFDLNEFCPQETQLTDVDPFSQASREIDTRLTLQAGHYDAESDLDFTTDRDLYDLSEHLSGTALDYLCSLIESPKTWCLEHYPNWQLRNIPPNEVAKAFRALTPSIRKQLGFSENKDILEDYLRSSYFVAFLKKLHRHSLLVEFAMSSAGDEIICLPYHSSAVHEVEMPRASDLLMGRPGVLARNTLGLFSSEIQAFQRLLNAPETRERHIQTFLETHQNFLRGLSYKNIYPQLVLEREGDGKLIPDFILEPFDGAWCDILDVKLPKQPFIVGRNDRKALASGIHEVAAQLREYAAYFEQEKYQKFVKQKYGLNLYKPRLIALVGRDLAQMSSPELRRAITAYEGLKIMTFDELIRHSQSRILI